VEAVFNYDIPTDDEYYVHRIGRTARAGKAGLAFTFVIGKEAYRIKQIQRFTKTKIKAQRVPSISDVEEIRTNMLLENVKEIIDAGHLGEYSSLVEKLIEEEYTSVDVAAALLKMTIEKESKEMQARG
jgi:ATP-dependent RNA helicase DeaD